MGLRGVQSLCRDSFFRKMPLFGRGNMARPLKCRLGFHGKIAWDKEPIKDKDKTPIKDKDK